MSIEQMRVYIAEHPKYKNSPNWRYRCQTMPSSQVVAIYNNFRKMDYKKIEKELKAQDKEEVIKRRDNDADILALKADVSRLSELSQNATNSKNTELAQIKTDVEEALKSFGFSTISNVSNFIETSTALNNTINDIQAIDDTEKISTQYATQQLKEYSQKYEETLKTLQSTELELTPEHREMLEKHLQILKETITILEASLKGGE